MNKTLNLHVEGMSCNNCSGKVETTLSALKGVRQALVDLDAKNVKIDFNPDEITLEDLKFAIKKAGYDATEKSRVTTLVMEIEGMSCEHCVKTVNAKLNEMPGTREVSIVLPDGRAWISYDTSEHTAEDYKVAVEEAGYKVLEFGATPTSSSEKKMPL
jgi:Cu+-exporting ATPase